MAIGYTTVISKFNEFFFDEFLNGIKNSYSLFDSNQEIWIVDDDGEDIFLSEGGLKILFSNHNNVYIRFKNVHDNYIGCTIRNLGYLVTEEYSMDELLTDQEKNELWDFVEKRFLLLRSLRLNIGFIFDLEGYSENYIRIDNNVW